MRSVALVEPDLGRGSRRLSYLSCLVCVVLSERDGQEMVGEKENVMTTVKNPESCAGREVEVAEDEGVSIVVVFLEEVAVVLATEVVVALSS